MISFTTKGDFKHAERFLKRMESGDWKPDFNKYGEMGVEALREATPRLTGKTAESWGYEVTEDENGAKISWYNTNENKGYSIALLIQYGHGHKGGWYVSGRNYINPAMKTVFDQIAEEVWEEVKNS